MQHIFQERPVFPRIQQAEIKPALYIFILRDIPKAVCKLFHAGSLCMVHGHNVPCNFSHFPACPVLPEQWRQVEIWAGFCLPTALEHSQCIHYPGIGLCYLVDLRFIPLPQLFSHFFPELFHKFRITFHNLLPSILKSSRRTKHSGYRI